MKLLVVVVLELEGYTAGRQQGVVHSEANAASDLRRYTCNYLKMGMVVFMKIIRAIKKKKTNYKQ